MKFLVFTDLHEDKQMLKELMTRASQDDIDFIVTAGDISVFGRGLRVVLQELQKLGKKVYLVPGNHEEPLEGFAAITKEFSNCVNLHANAAKVGNYVLLGFGGGGFAMEDPVFRKIARQWYGKYKHEKTVLLTHQPPFGTKLDLLGDRHVGNKDYTRFIRRIKPKLAISGHLHETVGEIDQLDETKLINPGWEGMVVELN